MQKMQETQLWSLGLEDPLKKEMATSIFAWEIPWTEEPGGLQSMVSQRVRHDSTTVGKGWRCKAQRSFPGGSGGKESPAMQETWVWSLGGGRAPGGRAWQPTPVFLPGESAWTKEPGRLQFVGSQRIGRDWVTKHSKAQKQRFHISTKITELELFSSWAMKTKKRISLADN